MDKIEVTQADRESASRLMADVGLFSNILTAKAVQAFARHRLATRTDATPVAEVAELRGNISIMEAALQQIAGTHAERFGMCQTDVEEVPDLSAEEAVSIARNALEAAGDTHPPATDVAALVEALRTIQRETTAVTPELENLELCVGTIHSYVTKVLAPFTKGQTDQERQEWEAGR